MSKIRFTVFFLVLFFLHLFFFQYLSIGEIYPDFFLVLVVYCALRRGPTLGSVSGFATGMVQDSFNFAYFGLHALTKTIIGYTTGKVRHSFFSNNYLVQASIIFSAKILHDVLLYGVYLFSGSSGWWRQILFNTIPSALYTSAAGVAIYIIFNLKTRT